MNKAINSLNWHSNNLASESCQNLQSKTIWIPDLHDGPRVDIATTLVHLGFKPILGESTHRWKRVGGTYPEAIKLSGHSNRLSNLQKKFVTSQSKLDEASLLEHFNFYKDDPQFNQADAVICSFPMHLCEAFIALNRTIIFNPGHRYNLGECSFQEWTKLNLNYGMLANKSKLVIAAMSKYDTEYQFHYTGLRGYRLYGYGGYYAKNVEYKPVDKIILVGPTTHLGPAGEQKLRELNDFSQKVSAGFVFKKIRNHYKDYTLKQLATHRAIIVFPYAVMTYSIIDFYVSNIPLFFPSIKLLTQWKNVHDRTVDAPFYCGHTFNISFHPAHSNLSEHPYNPNDDGDEAYSYWLQYADYFDWPHVTVFESWQDLIDKLNRVNLNEISQNMKKFNLVKETDLLDNWCKISRDLRSPVMPKSYQEALDYFGTNKFSNL